MESSDTLKRVLAQGITDEVLDALDRLFPERTPELADSVDQIRYSTGQRSVIRFLQALKQTASGDAL
jgi:hypothetical protein